MFLVDQLILLGGVLLLIGIVSSKLSTRVGLPVLVLFLGVGMLAGEDGLGIPFDDFVAAHAVGTVALAIILFDGGLNTGLAALRSAWKPAMVLATAGVVVTAGITGVAAAWILGLPLLAGLLLGSIVASTDAAAVFSVLRSQGVHLRQRLASVLEIESGSNDPMAIFLTLGVLGLLQGRLDSWTGGVLLFVQQMGIGALAGAACGWAAVRVINRSNLATAGLYPVFAVAFGFIAFGLAASLGGSGFLSIYLAGLFIGNSRVVFRRGTFMFMDGLAWMGQIAMFVLLGLLSTPSDVLPLAGPSLLISAVLILVARPLSVVPMLIPFGFTWREIVLVSWVGLKGAVPIILATFPLIFGLPEGRLLFNVVFFVVLVSAVLQGWTLPLIASKLGLGVGRPSPPAVSLELMALRDVDGQIGDYVVTPQSALAGRKVSELGLPEGVLIAMISRGTSLVAPRGSTVLQPGDHLFVIARGELQDAVDAALGAAPERQD